MATINMAEAEKQRREYFAKQGKQDSDSSGGTINMAEAERQRREYLTRQGRANAPQTLKPSALRRFAERQTAQEANMGNPSAVPETDEAKINVQYQQQVGNAVRKAVTPQQQKAMRLYAKQKELTRQYMNAKTAEEQQAAYDELRTVQQYLPGYVRVLDKITGAVGGGIVSAEAGVAKALNPLAKGSEADRVLQNIQETNTMNKAGMGKVGGFVYDAAQTLTNNAAAIAAGVATGGALNPLITMGVSAGGQGVYDAQQDGASDKQSIVSGLMTGITEAAFEKIPLDNLFKTAGRTITGQVIEREAQGVLRSLAKQAGLEATSEGLTTLAQDVANLAIYEKENNPDLNLSEWTKGLLKDVGYSALLGGAVGGAMGGAAGVIGRGTQKNAAQAAQLSDGEQQTIPAASKAHGRNLTAENQENNSWESRYYVNGNRAHLYSRDFQRGYEIPAKSELDFTLDGSGGVELKTALVPELDAADYKDFAKAYAAKNLITEFDNNNNMVNPKPLTIKADGQQVIITHTGIRDVLKNVRGNRKSAAVLDSIFVLDDIIAGAHKISESPNTKGRVNPYSYYQNIFTDSKGQRYNVEIHIKKTPDTGRYYYHSLQEAEIRIEPLDPTSSDSNSTAGAEVIASGSDTYNIPNDGKYVKGQNSLQPFNPQALVQKNIADVSNFAKMMDRAGAKVLTEMYDGTQQSDAYVDEMNRAYKAGKAGKDIAGVAAQIHTLTPPQLNAAYLAGQADEQAKKQKKPNKEQDAALEQPYVERMKQSKKQNKKRENTVLSADSKTITQEDRKPENTVLLTAEKRTSVNVDPATHTSEQMAVLSEYVDAADEGLMDFAERYIENPHAKFGRYTISDVSTRQAKGLQNALGEDFGGYKNAINSDGILHITKRHGINGEHDNTMREPADIARIGYVLNNFDNIEILTEQDGSPAVSPAFKNSKNHYAPLMRFSKKIDGNYYVVEAAADNAYKKLWVVSAYMDKNNSGAVTGGPHAAKTTLGDTSETSLPSPNSAVNNNIPNDGEYVNTKKAAGQTDQARLSDGEVEQRRGERAIDHSEEWTAERNKNANKDTKPRPLSDIIESIRHDFGLNITNGHIRVRGVRGQYNVKTEGIRTRIANDLPTIAHELGHHIDHTYNIRNGLTQEMKQELLSQMDDEFRESYSQKQQLGEGIAEYVRKFLQNQETAAIDYPLFTKYFKEQLSGRERVLLNQLADEVNAYYALDADTAASSIRLREEGAPDARTKIEKLLDQGDALYQSWTDSNHGIRLFDEATGSDVYKLATNSAYSDAIAGQIITGDLTSPNGKYVAPGLKTALHGVDTRNPEEYKAFGEYLIMRHGPEYLADGFRVFADDRKNSTAWMNARQAEMEEQYPQFEAAAKRLYQFLADFNQTWGVGTQLIQAKKLVEWQEHSPNYVPFNRAIPRAPKGAKRGFANQHSPYKRRKGSGLDIVHPVDNIIDQIVLMVNTGVRNNVMLALRNAAVKEGAEAAFMEKVPTPLRPNSIHLDGLKQQLQGDMAGSGMSAEAKSEAEQIIDGISDVLLQFQCGNAKNDVVTVMVNGKPEFWKINDKLLLESVTSMTSTQRDGFLAALNTVTRFITGNITGNNIIWSIFSNMPRDLQTLFVYTRKGQHGNVIKSFFDSYTNAFKQAAGKDVDPLYAEYLAMGGGHTSVYSADAKLAERARQKLTASRNKLRRVWDTVNPLSLIPYISDIIEQGPRFATYKAMRKAGLTPQEAFYEAMDITTNFRRGGSGKVSRDANILFPFFNAGVQGIDKFTRYFTAEDAKGSGRKTRLKVVSVRAGAWIAASAVLALLSTLVNFRDDEAEKNYEQLSNYTKNAYYCIPLGEGMFFTIPKPRELGALTSLMEVCFERYIGDNKHAFDEFWSYAVDNFTPPALSDVVQLPLNIAKDGLNEGLIDSFMGAMGSASIIGVGVNVAANRDFLGKPIVSASLENLEPKDQFNSSTSKIAWWIGQALPDKFSLSPAQIDYLGKNILGYLWKLPSALLPLNGEPDYSLGVKATYFKDNAYSQDLVNWLYDRADKSGKAANSNPDDMDKAIKAKLDADMIKFYGRFNKLNRDKKNTEERRHTRQTVLDMLGEYRKYCDSGIDTKAQQVVYDFVRQTGDTSYMPSVMNDYVKDGNDAKHNLSDSQYVTYQTRYLAAYWDYVEQNLRSGLSSRQKEAIMQAAKEAAKESATNTMLRRINAPATKYEQKYSGVSANDVIEFEAGMDMAHDDGSLNQDEVVNILEIMIDKGLSYEDAYSLFHARYSRSDKNNPWRGYAQ